MHKCYLLLGSNQGEKARNIESALKAINKRVGTISKSSSVFESEPWGFESHESFLNLIAVVDTKLTPAKVLKIILDIETKLGRVRENKAGYQSRTMDIDILFFDNEILDHKNLTIPHPRLHLRRFTLEPLNEIAPELIHPGLGKSISELLENCPDQSRVTNFTILKTKKIS